MQKSIPYLTTLLVGLFALPVGAELVLVENGESRMPIVIFENAPPLTRQAADELAYYIEKTSGARPEIIEGEPDPLPDKAIWVGYQPVLKELFPDLDFDFQHPEEILITANDRHLVIAGRDQWDPEHLTVTFGRRTIDGVQQEYGTHNAVYTFLQDYLGVRWLWPGQLGEDVLPQPTIAFAPFEYRYHPQVRARSLLLNWTQLFRGGVIGPDHPGVGGGGAVSGYWARAQRLQLDSLGPISGLSFGNWWSRFHETHPEYFAWQPDGTRGGGEKPYPSAHTIKLCVSNPDVWQQWLVDAEALLERNPNQRIFDASPGDSHFSGHCVCENCLAWDHPEGEPRRLIWQGLAEHHVSLSERYVIFANHLARLLKTRFPDRELYVYTYAYGVSLPPPVEAVAADNVIIGPVANFLLRSDFIDVNSPSGRTHREYFAGWRDFTRMNFWRPNTGAPVGSQWGMPDVPLRRTSKDLKFTAAHGMMGIQVDFIREHWSTQGPLYYLMAQLVWNPSADGEAILKDYYQRAFGPAAREMEAYWDYMEDIREECYGTEQPGRADHDIPEFYNAERLAKATDLLEAAQAALGPDDDRYRERIAFVEVGLEVTRLITECARLARLVEKHEDPDGTARTRIHANWGKLRALQQAHPGGMRWNMFWEGSRGDGKPTTPAYAPTLWVDDAPEGAVALPTAEWLRSEKISVSKDWELVFEDNFGRDEVGGNWETVDGSSWEIVDGWLRGSGVLVSGQGFPGGFQRLEFEAMTDVASVQFEGSAMEVPVCDMSSFIQSNPPAAGNPMRSGYFFQFGGFNNTRNGIRKAWRPLADRRDNTVLITPGKLHKVVVENDAGVLRLMVDGEVALEHAERGAPLLGEGRDRVGFFFLTPAKVRQVKVYVKRTGEQPTQSEVE